MNNLHDLRRTAVPDGEQARRTARPALLPGALLALLLAAALLFAFAGFRAAQSETRSDATLQRGRTGETLPANMAPGFPLVYTVGGGDLAAALGEALPAALAGTNAGQATAVADPNAAAAPRLWIEVAAPHYLWTPFYATAEVAATFYMASHAAVPWPEDAPMHMAASPEIQARGELTLRDRTWGLLSRPAYRRLLAEQLAAGIAAQLQQGVFTLPPAP